MALTVGSLFAGIGGFDLAFEAAGFEIAFQVEIDEFCLKVLEKHWPLVQRERDVRDCHGWITSLEDSHVRTCRPLASAQGSTENDQDCTANSSDSLMNSDRAASCSKTSTMLGASGCPSCGASCGRSGIPLCQFACAPVILGPGINEAASSSWPTLTHQSYGSNRGGGAGRSGKIRPSLPTLIRRDSLKGGKANPRGKNSPGGTPFSVAIHSLPTPTRCGNYNRKGASPTSGDGLATAVGGRLNPTWCEWYMGFPLGWTDVAWPLASVRSVMPLSRPSSSGSPSASKKRKQRRHDP